MQKLLEKLRLPSPIEKVDFPSWKPFGKNIFFKRDDLIHPYISGNKWRKLEGFLEEFYRHNYKGILTFGGAYSNHITATAAAAKILNIPSIGIIRGEIAPENHAIQYAMSQEMLLLPVSRQIYRDKDLDAIQSLYPHMAFSDYFIVPEGGFGILGTKACQNITQEIEFDFDHMVMACGTGTTLAGVVESTDSHQLITGISVLKGEDTLTANVKSLTHKGHFNILSEYHCGGYAKYNEGLIAFALEFTRQTSIPLDYVYTAKMVFAFHDLLQKGYFDTSKTIILLHTGGCKNAPIV